MSINVETSYGHKAVIDVTPDYRIAYHQSRDHDDIFVKVTFIGRHSSVDSISKEEFDKVHEAAEALLAAQAALREACFGKEEGK